MKRMFTTFMTILLVAGLMAQQVTKAGNKVTVIEEDQKTTVKVGNEEFVYVEEGGDTTKIRIGKKGVTIIESEDGSTSVEWDDIEDMDLDGDDSFDHDDEKSNRKPKFKPHWAGFEIGLNNFVNSDFNMDLAPENSFMKLNTEKSWAVSLNLLEYGLTLGTDKVGLVTGLGFEWNNYFFDGGNVIKKGEDGTIIEYMIPDENASIRRAKLRTTYLNAPLLLEFQIPAGDHRIFISGGVIGALKLGSKTKTVYSVDGGKQKDKEKSDFYLSPLRYGFTARVGYRAVKLFANYYPTSLFESGRGPELYPFSVGLTLISF